MDVGDGADLAGVGDAHVSASPCIAGLPFDILRIIVDFACAGPPTDELSIAAIDPLPLDERDSPSEPELYETHRRAVTSLSLVCRSLHEIATPHAWYRCELSNIEGHDALARSSVITPSDGHDPLPPFGHFVTHLSLAHLPAHFLTGRGSDDVLRAFKSLMPNVRVLELPLDSSQIRGGLAIGFWPALRGLRNASHGFDGLSGLGVDVAVARLARLPLLDSISSDERTPCFPPALIASLALRTSLINPLTRRPGLGLRDIIVTAAAIGAEETLLALVGACPNLCRLHIAAGTQPSSWPVLRVSSLLACLPVSLVHFGMRPRVDALIGSFDAVLDRLPRLRSLALRARFASFELIRRMDAGEHGLERLELRDSFHGQATPGDRDGGLVLASRRAVQVGCRRLLESRAAVGVDVLDLPLLAYTHASVQIELGCSSGVGSLASLSL